jgi:hypothetical protein
MLDPGTNLWRARDAASDPNPNPDDRGPDVFAVTTAMISLATLFVAGRAISRVAIVRRTGWDDYTMLLAWLIAVFLSISIIIGTRRGLGRRDKDIDPEKEAGLRMAEYVFSVLYVRLSRRLVWWWMCGLMWDRTRRSWRPRPRS